MKQRSPVLSYLLMIFSLGIYFIYWMGSLMKDVNYIKNQRVFNVKLKVGILAGFLTVYYIGFISLLIVIFKVFLGGGELSAEFYICFAALYIIAIVWLVLTAVNMAQAAKQIMNLEEMLWIPNRISVPLSVVLLFVYAAAVPYVQLHMNKIIETYQVQRNTVS